MEKFRQYKNYAIIAILTMFCLFFLPFTGSVMGLDFTFPDTAAGWLVFIINKLIIGFVNIMILYCFCEQGKFNVRNEPRYIEARDILLGQLHLKELLPKSPAQHAREIYGKKGIAIFITSILGTISLTQAVLAFDVIVMLTYLFTITMGIIFGVIQMGYEEIYWTEDYYKYAVLVRDKEEEERARREEEERIQKALELREKELADTGNDTPDDIG